MKRDTPRCTRTRSVDIAVLAAERASKADCIKDIINQRLTHLVTISQSDLYLRCTKDWFSFSPFIHPDNHPSIPLTPSLSHTHTCTRSPSLPLYVLTPPQQSDLAPSVSHWPLWQENEGTGPSDWIIRGNPGESPPTFYVHSKTWVSNFHSLACMLHQTKTQLNSHFRCAGALFDFGFLVQTATREKSFSR